MLVLSRWTFIIAAICSGTAILVTYFLVPDMTGVDLLMRTCNSWNISKVTAGEEQSERVTTWL
jgi:hypothetical protein